MFREAIVFYKSVKGINLLSFWCTSNTIVILFDDLQAELFEKVGSEVDADDGDSKGDGVAQDGGVGHTALLF